MDPIPDLVHCVDVVLEYISLLADLACQDSHRKLLQGTQIVLYRVLVICFQVAEADVALKLDDQVDDGAESRVLLGYVFAIATQEIN